MYMTTQCMVHGMGDTLLRSMHVSKPCGKSAHEDSLPPTQQALSLERHTRMLMYCTPLSSQNKEHIHSSTVQAQIVSYKTHASAFQSDPNWISTLCHDLTASGGAGNGCAWQASASMSTGSAVPHCWLNRTHQQTAFLQLLRGFANAGTLLREQVDLPHIGWGGKPFLKRSELAPRTLHVGRQISPT